MLQFFSFRLASPARLAADGVAPWAMFTDPVGFILPGADPYAALSIAFLSRFMRSAVLEVLVQDYVRTAIAQRAAANVECLFRHAFRNALGPIVIILGLYFPGLFGGAVVIESVFNYSGLGIQIVNAASTSTSPPCSASRCSWPS